MNPTSSCPTAKRPMLPLSVLACSIALAGCSVLETEKIDYKSAKQTNTLEVPPDLTQLSRESRYVIPGSVVTASGYQVSQPSKSVATAATEVGDVRIERSGNQRWLVIGRSPDDLWEPVRGFWQENGFLLSMENQNLGIMETDWAENRAKLPQDIIRATIGKLFDSLYSTAERDKFRTRLERTSNGGTEIYVSHRGMQEVYTNERDAQTVWQPRPADPELEAEFLRRLMVKLGVTQEQAKALLASGATPSKTRMAKVGGQPAVEIDEGFDRAWRRVGLALDRTGFTVEDRNRAQGTYFVRYVPADAQQTASKPGFFGRLFGSSTTKEATPVRYRISVKSSETQTTVTVLNAQGQPETSANAERIVKIIADDLR